MEEVSTSRIKDILKNDGFTQEEIDTSIDKIVSNTNRELTVEGLGLTREPASLKFIQEKPVFAVLLKIQKKSRLN